MESFNGKQRNECLIEHDFISLGHLSSDIAAWRDRCNCERPQSPRLANAGGIRGHSRDYHETRISPLISGT
jgi:hypothetical protein